MARKKNLLNELWEPKGDDLSPTKKIMYHTYDVIASRSQVISPGLAEVLGVPASTFEVEAVARHGAINCTLNAPRLAELFAIGGRPMFRNVKMTVQLYRDLCEYLLAFRQAYENNVFKLESTEKMMDNVLKLENLAEWVFSIAQPYLPKEDLVAANSLAGRIGRGRFTRDVFAKKKEIEAKPLPADITIVTVGLPDDGPQHGRITDGVMEKHFEQQQRNQSRNKSGWG